MKDSRILLLDNYDSFTYNLVHAIEEVTHHKLDVFKNDQLDLASVEEYKYIILSPGPGLPDDAGILKDLISIYGPTKKILGVCLGLQAIAEVYGAKLKNLDQVYHGAATIVRQTKLDSILYQEINDGFTAGRYHSWVIDPETVPSDLAVTAIDDQHEIMSIQHKEFAVHGVQFHPESFMTKEGNKMLSNFFELA